MSKENKILFVVFITFFVTWFIVFRLGADSTLPSGFWKIIVLIFIFDIFQIILLKLFLLNKNFGFYILVFVLIGLSLGAILFEGVWIVLVSIISVLYALALKTFVVFLSYIMN